jgi:Leucine-rich repeat (LRR) protein
MSARSIGYTLVSLILLCWLSSAVHAVAVADGQKEVLYRIRDEAPALETLSQYPWTDSAIESACEIPSIYGVGECNSTGWVSKFGMSSGIFPSLSFPHSVCDMEGLTEFTLGSYQTTAGASFPECIGNLTSLQKLSLINTQTSGSSIPDHWKKLVSMRDFYFFTSDLDVPMPEWIGEEWPNLFYFTWSNTRSSGSLPAWIGTHPVLEYLTLSNNHFSGTLPEGLAQNPIPRILSVGNNDLTSLPDNWSNATRLDEIDISFNELTNLPSILPPAITTFRAGYNAFHSPIPQSYLDHPSIITLSLPSANLNGNLPWPEDPVNSRLARIDFSGSSSLAGSLSSSIWLMPSLDKFDIRFTGVMGPLPDEDITSNCYLSAFLASNSLIGGPLPTNIHLCARLNQFLMHNASVTGTIPDSFANFSSLYTLDLSQNLLEGPLPTDWSLSTSLATLYLDHNALTGPVPSSLANLTRSGFGYLNNLLLNNNQLDLCGDSSLNPDSINPNIAECDVSDQTPPPCGCAGVWTSCLPSGDMPSCPIPEEPSANPSGSDPEPSEPSEPTSSSPRSFFLSLSSFTLLALCLF